MQMANSIEKPMKTLAQATFLKNGTKSIKLIYFSILGSGILFKSAGQSWLTQFQGNKEWSTFEFLFYLAWDRECWGIVNPFEDIIFKKNNNGRNNKLWSKT